MLRHEAPGLARAGDLVGLLVILTGIIRIRRLGRKGIECHPLQLVGPAEIAGDPEHLFEGIHHLDRRAEFGAAGGVAEMDEFIAGPEPGRQPDRGPDYFQGPFRRPQRFGIL